MRPAVLIVTIAQFRECAEVANCIRKYRFYAGPRTPSEYGQQSSDTDSYYDYRELAATHGDYRRAQDYRGAPADGGYRMAGGHGSNLERSHVCWGSVLPSLLPLYGNLESVKHDPGYIKPVSRWLPCSLLACAHRSGQLSPARAQ